MLITALTMQVAQARIAGAEVVEPQHDADVRVNVPCAPAPLRMGHALGHALAVEVRHLLHQLIVLHQQRAARSRGLRILVVGHGRARGGGHEGRVAHAGVPAAHARASIDSTRTSF